MVTACQYACNKICQLAVCASMERGSRPQQVGQPGSVHGLAQDVYAAEHHTDLMTASSLSAQHVSILLFVCYACVTSTVCPTCHLPMSQQQLVKHPRCSGRGAVLLLGLFRSFSAHFSDTWIFVPHLDSCATPGLEGGCLGGRAIQ